MNEFVFSYIFSVIIQAVSLVIQGFGYTMQVHPSLRTLKYALNIEFFVSFVEIMVYLWIGTNLVNLKSVMKKRYLDWVITTNALMFSFSFLFHFFYERQNKTEINTQQFIRESIPKMRPIVLFNTLMLVCGYLGELNSVPRYVSFTSGFAFFFASFYYLYHYFAKYTNIGKYVFYAIAFIWSLYGVSHTLTEKWKNVSYNILDLISKNVFGVIFVFMLIHYNKIESSL